MKKESIYSGQLLELCDKVKDLMLLKQYDTCNSLICHAMMEYPSALHPHTLLGILLEKTGNHASAMKHFRAAQALDPTYGPATQNLTSYGTFYSQGGAAFNEQDCRHKEKYQSEIEYDGNGLGHITRRNTL